MRVFFMLALLCLGNTLFGQTKYQKDFTSFWQTIHDHYAYLEEQQINWENVKTIYEPRCASITTDDAFISLLASMLNELYNGHSSLNTNLASSNRLVPSGLDLRVEKIKEQFIVTDLRKKFAAE